MADSLTPDTASDDIRWMDHAVALAAPTRPSPNPRVGCVIVRGQQIVGQGAHQRSGTDHAEVVALREAGELSRGATVYVTLEPCNHFGKTPPCTEALMRAGVSRVVVGSRDPNPRVTGHGFERLIQHGIAMTQLDHAHCNALIDSWQHFTLTGRPFVILKVGMTLDGMVATSAGESRWITGTEARKDAHRMRAHADAVLVGSGTVRVDDPLLTVREGMEKAHQPLRVILDTNLRTGTDRSLMRTARDNTVHLFHGLDASRENARALADCGVSLHGVRTGDDHRVRLSDVLEILAHVGVVELMVEGGPTVHGAFLNAKLADRVVSYVAPIIMGGERSIGAFSGPGHARLSEAPRLHGLRVERLGDDLKLTGECRPCSPES